MKPTYNFFKNTHYALEGVRWLLKETSFRIELCIIIPCVILSFFLPLSLAECLLLILTLLGILIAEALNTAIEACVDLTTTQWHKQAKIAKDCASSAVFFSILSACLTWIAILAKLLLFS